MSEEARRNGWNGFDVAEKVEGGWMYVCDGMPRITGCGQHTIITRKFARVGLKKSGWLVCYGLEPKPEFGNKALFDEPSQWQEDHDIVLTFCPSCTGIVQDQMRRGVA